MVKSVAYKAEISLVAQYFETKDEKVFAQIYEIYFPLIHRYVEKLIVDTSMSHDLTQDVFVTVNQKFDKLNNPLTFKSWVFKIAYNKCMDYFRKRKKVSQKIEGYRYLYTNEVQDPNLISLKEDNILEQKIEKLPMLLSLLENDEQKLLETKYLENKTIAEIAKSMNCGCSSVKMKLLRTRRKVVKSYNFA